MKGICFSCAASRRAFEEQTQSKSKSFSNAKDRTQTAVRPGPTRRNTRRAGRSRKIGPIPHGPSLPPRGGRLGRNSRRRQAGKPTQSRKRFSAHEQLTNECERGGV